MWAIPSLGAVVFLWLLWTLSHLDWSPRLRVISSGCSVSGPAMSVYGTVRNISKAPIDQVEVVIRVRTVNNDVVNPHAPIGLQPIRPGQESSFRVSVNDAGSDTDNNCNLWFQDAAGRRIPAVVPELW